MYLFYICFTAYIYVAWRVTGQITEEYYPEMDVKEEDLPELSNETDNFKGGMRVAICIAPYQAAVIQDDGELLGSGAIIGKRFVLTSAFVHRPKARLFVRVGSENYAKKGQYMGVEKITVHEKYDNLYNYDVALLKLADEIIYGEDVKPIRLSPIPITNATPAVVSGFTIAEGNLPNHLRKGIQWVLVKETCQSYYVDRMVTLGDVHFCAYGKDTCCGHKDYGAPLVQRLELVGLFIGGSYCCEVDIPQLYVDVYVLNDWIRKNMNEQGYDLQDDVHYFYS